MSFRTDLISVKLSSIVDITELIPTHPQDLSAPQFLSEPPFYEGAFNVSQLRVQELAISPHVCLASPPRMICCSSGRHRPVPPPLCCQPSEHTLLFVGSRTLKPGETR